MIEMRTGGVSTESFDLGVISCVVSSNARAMDTDTRVVWAMQHRAPSWSVLRFSLFFRRHGGINRITHQAVQSDNLRSVNERIMLILTYSRNIETLAILSQVWTCRKSCKVAVEAFSVWSRWRSDATRFGYLQYVSAS